MAPNPLLCIVFVSNIVFCFCCPVDALSLDADAAGPSSIQRDPPLVVVAGHVERESRVLHKVS